MGTTAFQIQIIGGTFKEVQGIALYDMPFFAYDDGCKDGTRRWVVSHTKTGTKLPVGWNSSENAKVDVTLWWLALSDEVQGYLRSVSSLGEFADWMKEHKRELRLGLLEYDFKWVD